MKGFSVFRSAVSRPLSASGHRGKLSIGVSIVLVSLAGVMDLEAHSQTAFFSGAELTVPTDNLNQPNAIAVDQVGNLYIADSGNARVLKMTLSAGSYTESVVATETTQVNGIAVDSNGNIYFGNAGTGQILKETPSGGGGYSQSVVSTSSLTSIGGLAADTSGNVYVVDTGGSRVLKEALSGTNYTESTIGTGLVNPRGVAVDKSGNVYISDTGNGRVLMETLSGGSYTQSALIPSGITAYGVALDSAGDLYVVDAGNHRLLSGSVYGGSYAPTVAPTSSLDNPAGIAVDSRANAYIVQAISGSTAVLKEFPFTRAPSFVPANVGTSGAGMTVFFTFDNGGTIGKPGVSTQGTTGLDFNDANTGSCTANGTTHSYSSNDTCAVNVVFKPIAPGSRYGAVVLLNSSGSPIATAYVQGTGVGPQVNFPPGTQSVLSFKTPTNPFAMAVDAAGNLYITQTATVGNPNSVVKESWTGSGYTETTVASGLVYPVGVAVDGAGNVYIADQDASEVVKETPTSSGGYTQTAAFTGLGSVEAVAVDASGDVYIGSLAYHLVKESLLLGSYFSSSINTAAYPFGIAVDGNGNVFFTGNDSNLYEVPIPSGNYTTITIASGFSRALGVAIDSNSNLYVADIGSRSVFKEAPSAGTYAQSTLTTGLGVEGIAVDGQGNVYLCGDDVADGVGIWKQDFADPPSLSFATTVNGSTSSDSPKSVTVENFGNAALSFPVPATGSNPGIAANFALNSNPGACPVVTASSQSAGTLAAGASCALPISFTPTATGNLSGSLILTDNAFNPLGSGYATQTILLSGNATLATPSITWAASAAIAYGTALSSTQLDASSTVAGTFTYSPAAGTQLSVGPHTLSVTLMPTDTTDYTTATATTAIIVNQATPSITWAAPAPIVYGTALSANQLNATASVTGTFTYSPAVGTLLNSGPQTLSVTFAPTDTTDYTTATATTNITVSPATPTLSFTPIPAQANGVAPFAVGATSASSGAVTYAVVSGPATIAANMLTITGVGTVVLSASQAAGGNYSATTATTSFNVTVPFTLASTTGTPGSSVNVAPGGTATFGLTLTPGSGTKFVDAVTFAATGLPSGAAATFSPATVPAGSAVTSVTLTIQTPTTQTARSETRYLHTSRSSTLWGFLLFPMLGLTCARRRLPRTRGLLIWLFFGALSAGAGMSLIGCSSSDGGARQSTSSPQTYTVVATATDQATGVKSSMSLTLTVQ